MAFALLAWSSSCDSGQTQANTLTIAVAANLQFAMQPLKEAFEDESGAELEVVLSSSGKLTSQIMQGAPYDLLLSANLSYPRKLLEDGMAADSLLVYAYGKLALWTMKDHLPLARDSLGVLLAPEVRKIAVARPELAPYGEAAFQLFRSVGILDSLMPKFVYGESIAQTNQYIRSGSADIGLTANSVMHYEDMGGKGQWLLLPHRLYQPVRQGMVVTKHGVENNPELARRFFTFMQSEQARQILMDYGYGLPD